MTSCSRACWMSMSMSVVTESSCGSSTCPGMGGAGSVVRVAEDRITVVVERPDSLDAVGVDRGAPVGLHHDADRLLDRLTLSRPDGVLHGLDRRRGVARDLRSDAQGG